MIFHSSSSLEKSLAFSTRYNLAAAGCDGFHRLTLVHPVNRINSINNPPVSFVSHLLLLRRTRPKQIGLKVMIFHSSSGLEKSLPFSTRYNLAAAGCDDFHRLTFGSPGE